MTTSDLTTSAPIGSGRRKSQPLGASVKDDTTIQYEHRIQF